MDELLADLYVSGRASPCRPAPPYWIGLDHDIYHVQLADLRHWTDTVLRQHYGGYELQDCWPRAIWGLSTLAAEWHRTYSGALTQDEASQRRRGASACPWSLHPPHVRPFPDRAQTAGGLAGLGSHKGPVTLAIVRPSVRLDRGRVGFVS